MVMNYDIMQGVSQSILVDWMTCRQRGKYRGAGWRPVESRDTMFLGKLVHAMLDAHYARREWNLVTFLREDGIPSEEALSEKQHETVCKAYAILDAYKVFWKKADSKRKWTETEQQFAITEPRSCVLMRGKRDAAYEHHRKRWLFETKTTGRYDEDAKTLQVMINFQTLYYLASMYLETGKWPSGVLHNIIIPPGIRLKQKQTPDEYRIEYRDRLLDDPEKHFVRFEVSMPETFLTQWYSTELVPLLTEFRDWSDGLRPTYRNSDRWVCSGAFTCDYLRCCATASMVGYSKGKVFPELEGVDDGKNTSQETSSKAKSAASSHNTTSTCGCTETRTKRSPKRLSR